MGASRSLEDAVTCHPLTDSLPGLLALLRPLLVRACPCQFPAPSPVSYLRGEWPGPVRDRIPIFGPAACRGSQPGHRIRHGLLSSKPGAMSGGAYMTMSMQLGQYMLPPDAWIPPSALPRVERGLSGGTIDREMISILTPGFTGSSAVDEALVALLPRLESVVLRYYDGTGGALRELVSRRELPVLDRWLCRELERLTLLWRRLEAASDRRASALNAIPGQLRSDMLRQVSWLRIERVVRRLTRMG